jgi:predicted DNA binding CopG/RHH family protein
VAADKEKGINFKVDENFYKKVKIKVATEGITIKDYVIRLIEQDLNQNNK